MVTGYTCRDESSEDVRREKVAPGTYITHTAAAASPDQPINQRPFISPASLWISGRQQARSRDGDFWGGGGINLHIKANFICII